MATTLVPVVGAAGIQACANSGRRRQEQDRRRSSSGSWWTPLFGWSSEPDYIDYNSNKASPASAQEKPESDPAAAKAPRPSFSGGFTEEKAKQLRLMTVGTKNFHDTMYHSSIASRLASDFKARSDL